jgi:VWFA-related protein
MRLRALALLAAAVGMTGAAPGQEAGSGRTVIRSETRLVLVDAVVTDKKGAYVRDLKAKEFRVWEDNKEQTITNVGFQADAAGTAGQKGYLILLFDNASMDAVGQAEAKQAATRMLGLEGAEDRMTAVAVFNRAIGIVQNFTGDAERLTQAVAKIPPAVGRIRSSAAAAGGGFASADTRGSSDPFGGVARSPGQPSNGAGDIDMARSFLLSLANLARGVAGVPGRKTLVWFTGGFGYNAAPDLQTAVNACNRANVAVYPVDTRGLGRLRGSLGWSGGDWAGLLSRAGISLAAGPVLRMAESMTAGLAFEPGAGQAKPTTPPAPTAPTTPPAPAAPAGGAGTTAETGITGRVPAAPGMRTTPTSQGPSTVTNLRPGDMDASEFLSALADRTGGFVIRNSNDLLAGLQKIAKEEREYYLLSYTPPESSTGNCHALRVKVSRGGTTLRSRTSYCFTKPADILAGTPAERELQGRLAGSEAGAATAAMQAPFFYAGPAAARVNLTMEIPSGGVRFENVKGKFHAEVNVLAIAYREDQPAARSSDVVRLDFNDQAAVDAFKQKPLHYENQFEIAPGKYHLKVAFGQTGGVFGRLESPLDIDAYDGQRLGISALTFSRQTRPAPEASSMDIELTEGRTPLVARNVEYIPSGENRFPRGERFRLYFELYDPQLLTGASSVTARIETFDKKTGRSMSGLDMGNVSGNARPGTNTIAVGITMPALPPGSYRTELHAAGAAPDSAARSVEFDVN